MRAGNRIDRIGTALLVFLSGIARRVQCPPFCFKNQDFMIECLKKESSLFMNNYQPVIGLEIHAELKTKSKMFCSCPNAFGLEKEPNQNICEVCTGQPGALPVINEEAVKKVLKTALTLNCQINDWAKFDRKNYFYPDLPKGYQISQYDAPFSQNGFLEILGAKIRITRIHLEEDTGKLVHPAAADYSLVDLNRAGVPLMELVTEPDLKSGLETRQFCQELQLILRYLDVSDADMEKGQMRCEVNISLREIPRNDAEFADAELRGKEKKLGTKVEIKNLNSFRAVEHSIDYEIKRQTEILARGEKIVQETRGWDDAKGETFSQRVKEEAHDYRYFPEPDLPPLAGLDVLARELKKEIPELPAQKRERLAKEYNLPSGDVEILVSNLETARYFEATASELANWAKSAEPKIDLNKAVKLAVNYLITEIPRIANSLQIADYKLSEKITPENFAEFTKVILQGVISSSGAQTLLKEMFLTGADPSHIIQEKDLTQVSGEEELNQAISEVLSANPGPAEDYKKGKQNALMFLVGKVMAQTRGKANPQVVTGMLRKRMKE